MIAWIFLLVLLVAEVLVLRWWLNKEYYPVMFNGWAATIYCAALTVNFILMLVVASIFTPGETSWPQLLVFLGAGAFVLTILFTFFFRWVIKQELSDPK